MNDDVVARKKKWIFVPQVATGWHCPARLHLEHRIAHPTTGSDIFGVLPPIRIARKTIFAGGQIVLRYGKHVGDKHSLKGFGFRHIWARRFPGIEDHDIAMEEVVALVASIIQPGTEIYYEHGDRAAIFCNANGEVIVEERGAPGDPFYSVVTAIRHPVQPKGSRVGALR